MKWFRCSHADVYDTLLKRWQDLDARVSRLETSEAVFRDKVLRKIQTQKGTEEPEKPKDPYNGVLIGMS